MNKYLIMIFILLFSAYADDRFDMQRLGKTTEKLYELYKKQTKDILELKEKVYQQDQELKNLYEIVERLRTKNVVVLNKPIKHTNQDYQLINRKSGTVSFARPVYGDIFINRYHFKQKVYIEFCDKFGWCKLLNKNEYIAKYNLL